jgi:hypothetical protein
MFPRATEKNRHEMHLKAGKTSIYWYAAQSPSTDGHPSVMFLSIAPVHDPIGLPRKDARRFACLYRGATAGLGGYS